MSKEAQAERERHARVILSQAEVEVAQKFNQAALIYGANPVALSLRSMNMLSDAIKARGALVVVPSNAVETLGLGTISGLSALSQNMLPNAPHLDFNNMPNGSPPPPQTHDPAAANPPVAVPNPVPPPAPARRQPPQQPGNPAPYTPWPNTSGNP